ncbi:MAG: bifunctional glutamate N-acetyltransferase/amino-acid acetyltransferase ArgJ, partial [Flavobacteriales bacterium]
VGVIYTQNEVIAEPIKQAKEHLKDGKAQVIVCNAGNANACTGEEGRKGADAMAETTANELGISKEMVIIASTGMIGVPFPTDDIVNGIKENTNKLTNKSNAGSLAANAILTTDTFAKEGYTNFEVNGTTYNIAGIAKGSGMIHPNMATMLAFIVCDIAISPELLQKTVKWAGDRSFNMITVDGDTSTNDMCTVLANGMAENEELTSENDEGYEIFRDKLLELMVHLAKTIVSDGEGSSKFIEYKVVNSPEEETARKLIRTISDSSLVKTAIYGRDPNWGRIICAAGNAGVSFDYETVDLYIGSEDRFVKLLEKGTPQEFDRNYMKKILRESLVHITMDMQAGSAQATG